MTEQRYGCDTPQAHAFDFIVGKWTVHNKLHLPTGTVLEFEAVNRGARYLDGCTIVDTFDSTFPDGEPFNGLTIRVYDRQVDEWSILWFDNRYQPNFTPLKGKFENGIGTFSGEKPTADGDVYQVRFAWDNITETSARWQQFRSYDGGETWQTTWLMEFNRPQP